MPRATWQLGSSPSFTSRWQRVSSWSTLSCFRRVMSRSVSQSRWALLDVLADVLGPGRLEAAAPDQRGGAGLDVVLDGLVPVRRDDHVERRVRLAMGADERDAVGELLGP